MDIAGFKRMLMKSDRNRIITGGFIFLFGVFILWLLLSGADSEADDISTGGMVVLWVLIAICLGVGGLIAYMGTKSIGQVKSGKHPIIKAIESGDKGYLIWIYEYITQVKGGGSSHQVWAYSQEGKHYTLSAKKDKIQPIIQFLSSNFPNAVLGYSDEIATQMKQNLGKKIR